jgi:hypothetical protein
MKNEFTYCRLKLLNIVEETMYKKLWLKPFDTCTTYTSVRVLKINVLALGAVADFGAQNCQYTTNADAR